MQVAAIDPGKTGAVAFVNSRTGLASVFDLPNTFIGKRETTDPHALAEMFAEHLPIMVVIENVATRPKQGISSAGNFMFGAGVLYGVAGGRGCLTHHVAPAKWKRDLSLIGKSKEASRALAISLFPELASFLKRKKDADRAEALLMAHHYIMFTLGGYAASSHAQETVTASIAPLSNKTYQRRKASRQGSSTPVRRRSGSRIALTG
jgi:crossover junction endodeoxyribonuclease RuvC